MGWLALLLVASWAGLAASSDDGDTVSFVDVTQASGITFLHQSAPEKKYIVESMSGGVLLLDFDNDGWIDIYFVNSQTVEFATRPEASPEDGPASHLYRNRGDWVFEEVGRKAGVAYPGWGMGGCIGDYDGDGFPDIYVTNLGPNRIFRNRGDGTFEERSAEVGVGDVRWSAGCGFADYDNDGDLDLFVANYVDFKLNDLPEFGKGNLCQYKGIPVQCGPRGLPGAGDALFRNDGGKFTDVSRQAGVSDPEGYYGMGVIWSDIDLDGHVDLFVANDSRPNFMYRNRGDGTFEELGFLAGTAVGEDGSEQGSMGVAVGDYDRDGDLDLFVTNFSEEYNTVYRFDQDFTYTDTSFATRTAEDSFRHVGWGTEFFDYDNDGWLDLFAVNGHVYPQVDGAALGTTYAQRKLFYRNNRDGTFSEIGGDMGGVWLERRVSRGGVVGDLDNDGDLDVVINDLDGAPMVLRNDGGNRRNWLRVRLVGTGKNRLALGARVRVTAGEVRLIGEVRSGSSYLSQNDLRLHFGLGELLRVDRVEVWWPGGGSPVALADVAANQEITIRQE